MRDFLGSLRSGKLLFMDGAMGTELQKQGMAEGECYELWNLTHAEQVRSIHRAYVDAGADCLATNTFQANPAALARFGLENRLEEIIHAGIDLARSAAGPEPFVLASVGPFPLSEDSLGRVLRSMNQADGILLETWSDSFEQVIALAVDPACNPARLPVCLSLAFLNGPGGEPCLPISGQSPPAVARIAARYPIAALGANCGKDIGAEQMRAIVAGYRSATDLPLFVRPNAGSPQKFDGHWIYPHSPAEMANWLSSLDVNMIGGCCGTTPVHIVMLRLATKNTKRHKN
jgi:5-methyltetrahydrofolate--homocysteine methyltransferase